MILLTQKNQLNFNMKITDVEEFERIIHENENVIVDFFGTWCGPCKLISPVMDELEKDYTDKLKILKVDVDTCSKIVEKYSIKSIPAILFLKNGVIIEKHFGAAPKSFFIPKIEKLLK